MADAKSNTRARLSLPPKGDPILELLDSSGRVKFKAPSKKRR